MAETSWEMSALEFVVAWESLGRGRLPFPLAFREHRARSEQDLERRRAEAAEVLRDRYGDDLYRALATLAEPVVRVAVCGFAGPHSERMIRAHAGIGHRTSVAVVQAPGSGPDSGGDVVLSEHVGSGASSALVAAMPGVGAGRDRGIAVPRNRSAGPDGGTGAETDPDEAALFFNRAHSSFGEIAVARAGGGGSRTPLDGTVLQWIDYADDGRYLILHTQEIVARPASAGAVATEIDRLVRGVLEEQARQADGRA